MIKFAPAFSLCLWVYAADFDTVLREGLTALNHHDLATAQTQLEAAAKLQPGRPEPWLGLAQTYLRQDRKEAAEAAAARVETLHPTDPGILHALALYYSETGNAAKATDTRIAELQEALERRRYEESAYFDLAEQYLKIEKFQDAVETLDKGIKLFDKSAQLELARGVALYGLRRFPQSIDAFLRTIQLAPQVGQSYVFLGRMLDVAEGKLPAIARALGAYAQAQPNSYLANFLYAKALSAESGDANTIESRLRKSITLKNDFWESHYELGLAFERKRDFENAAKELERSVELNGAEPAPHYRLARIYDRLGKRAEAGQQRELHARLTAETKTAVK